MKIIHYFALPVLIFATHASTYAQTQPVDQWEINVRQMNPRLQAEITETMSQLKGSDEDRGLLAKLANTAATGLVSGVVDAFVAETFNLMHYRERQKEEWRQMIENENNYTDSIASVRGLKDFYNRPSQRGALDPSDINFDGIEIRGTRNGREVIYMTCSIDRTKLDNMFRHSKFNLVLDSLAFNPYMCHLPNVTANGIRTMVNIRKGKASVVADTIVRPGGGGNGFSFEERRSLRVGVDFTLSSSWINQAVQVHRDVELGTFRLNVSIPDNVIGTHIYSRRKMLARADSIADPEMRQNFLTDSLLTIDGDCFVVPRSFMPLDNGKPMWGTGEYKIKIKVRENCRLAENSDKARRWKEDYRRLRQMQRRSSEVQEYMQTLWKQYGTTMIKTTYGNAVGQVASELTGLNIKASVPK